MSTYTRITSFCLLASLAVTGFGKDRTQSTVIFKENKGQVVDQNQRPRSDVKFYGSTNGMSYYLKSDGISYQLYREDEKSLNRLDEPGGKTEAQTVSIYRVDISWPGANKYPRVAYSAQQPGIENYYTSITPATDVKSFGCLVYRDLYPSIDLKYYSDHGSLKYDYIVNPGGDHKKIQIKIDGAGRIVANEDGSLTVVTPFGSIEEGKPKVYQDGKPVEAKWVVKENVLCFDIGAYNKARPLIIDPLVRDWGTFYGGVMSTSGPGLGDDRGNAVCTDNSSNVFICGSTWSANNIATTGAYQTTATLTSLTAFVAKFNSLGIRQWGTYYGTGAFNWEATSCNADALGNIYLCVSNMLVKLSSAGTFQWSVNTGGSFPLQMYYGPSMHCVVSPSGSIYVTGFTANAGTIPTTGAFQSTIAGSNDAFIAKYNSSGTKVWATLYGGTGNDYFHDIKLAPNGDIVVAGQAGNGTNLTTIGAFQTTYTGATNSWQGMLARLDSNGNRLWASYYGPDSTIIYGCTIAANGDIYVDGQVANGSTGSNISTTGSWQATAGGGRYDAFLARFNSSGQRIWGTYYGGANIDQASSITSYNDKLYLTGVTRSSTKIASIGAAFQYIMPVNLNGTNTFVFAAEFDTAGARSYATYYALGTGPLAMSGYCTADQSGSVYITGMSGNFPALATPGAHQTTFGGGLWDAYLGKFNPCTAPVLSVSASSPAICAGDSVILSTTAVAGVSYQWYRNDTAINGATNSSYSTKTSGQYVLVETNSTGCIGYSSPTSISVNPAIQIIHATTDVPCSGAAIGSVNLTVSGGTPPYTYAWIGNAATTSGLINLTTGTYIATITDANGCTKKDTSTVVQNNIPMPSNPLVSICAVTVDSATGKNLVIYEKTGTRHASQYNIYRETSVAGQYALLGSNLAGVFSTYLDATSNPLQQSYLYRMTETDSCNNEFSQSVYHKTIHLSSNVGPNGEINLIWNQYEGRPYTTHYIMRSINSGVFVQIGQVSSNVTSYTDLTPPSGQKAYRIEIDLSSTCNPTAKTTGYERVSSNVVSQGVNGISNTTRNNIRLVPNPTSDIINIIGDRPASIRVLDIQGKLVAEHQNSTSISLKSLAAGVYVVRLYDKEGILYYYQRIIKE